MSSTITTGPYPGHSGSCIAYYNHYVYNHGTQHHSTHHSTHNSGLAVPAAQPVMGYPHQTVTHSSYYSYPYWGPVISY
ncbi:hypothetical protein [Heyndrickxia acidicola]|uniref:Uncharacterized protein n=1 Tax=Heyndrickxia acidicola TaxID=209389 RepID=A0ABU6MI61_9BACI|nr:hypothetical protein [Heyndrickxia acidicola]MED1204129.1 hypothetical protein [Heyndrickxia acidicola]